MKLSTNKLWNKLWEYIDLEYENELNQHNFNYGKLIINELVKRNDFSIEKFNNKVLEVYNNCDYN
jgi:hypothetical protein